MYHGLTSTKMYWLLNKGYQCIYLWWCRWSMHKHQISSSEKLLQIIKKKSILGSSCFFLIHNLMKKKCFSSSNMLHFKSKTKIYYKNIKNISFSFYYFGIISFCFINIQMHHIANKYPLIWIIISLISFKNLHVHNE